jgi:hypothetical protein
MLLPFPRVIVKKSLHIGNCANHRNGFILLCSLAGEQYRQMERDEEYDLDFMKVTADTLVQALIELTAGRSKSFVHQPITDSLIYLQSKTE